MDRHVVLLAVVAVLSCAARVSGCGFEGQGCSTGRSDRERRDILFPGEQVHDHDFNPITRYVSANVTMLSK